MSEQKTEQPTLKKFQDARKEGKIAKSSEITRGAQLTAAVLWFWLAGPSFVEELNQTFRQTIDHIKLSFDQALIRVVVDCMALLMRSMGSFILTLGLVILLTELAQTGGFLFASDKLKLNFEGLNPVNNIKNIFSLKKLYDLFEVILKITLLTIVFGYILQRYGGMLVYLPACGLNCAFPTFITLCAWLFGCLIAFYIVFATIDYFYERYQLTKQLKMSKEDIKQEFKETSGNPEIKKRMRELQMEMQNSSMPARVARSTAVIRNPMHIAICLYYKQGETPLPMVIEKGTGYNALEIIKIARRCKVPIVANVVLARQLMSDTQLDDYIPEKLFEPVAEILRVIMLELDDEETEESVKPAETTEDVPTA